MESLSALIALVLGIAPCIPGFLATISNSWKLYFTPAQPDAFNWVSLYPYAWFISFGVSFAVYSLLMALAPKQRS